MKFLSFLCTKWMGNCEAMTSSTRSFAYSYQLVKKCFLKICKTSKCHNFLIFQPIFIRFSLFYSQFFTLSYEIKLNLFRISPLKHVLRMHKHDFCGGAKYLHTRDIGKLKNMYAWFFFVCVCGGTCPPSPPPPIAMPLVKTDTYPVLKINFWWSSKKPSR